MMADTNAEAMEQVHPFTLDWWERLPRTYRVYDRSQEASVPVPLLRLMDGPGRIAGQMRDFNTTLWNGEAVNPSTAPAALLPWLAWITGVPADARQMDDAGLRERVRVQLTGQQIGIGTRAHIAESARAFLAPGARVQVIGSDTNPFTLIVGVADDDMLMSSEAMVRELRRAGVVPAGHALIVQDIRATWTQWEAAAGDTWQEKEQNIRRWEDSDTAGATLT